MHLRQSVPFPAPTASFGGVRKCSGFPGEGRHGHPARGGQSTGPKRVLSGAAESTKWRDCSFRAQKYGVVRHDPERHITWRVMSRLAVATAPLTPASGLDAPKQAPVARGGAWRSCTRRARPIVPPWRPVLLMRATPPPAAEQGSQGPPLARLDRQAASQWLPTPPIWPPWRGRPLRGCAPSRPQTAATAQALQGSQWVSGLGVVGRLGLRPYRA